MNTQEMLYPVKRLDPHAPIRTLTRDQIAEEINEGKIRRGDDDYFEYYEEIEAKAPAPKVPEEPEEPEESEPKTEIEPDEPPQTYKTRDMAAEKPRRRPGRARKTRPF